MSKSILLKISLILCCTVSLKSIRNLTRSRSFSGSAYTDYNGGSLRKAQSFSGSPSRSGMISTTPESTSPQHRGSAFDNPSSHPVVSKMAITPTALTADEDYSVDIPRDIPEAFEVERIKQVAKHLATLNNKIIARSKNPEERDPYFIFLPGDDNTLNHAPSTESSTAPQRFQQGGTSETDTSAISVAPAPRARFQPNPPSETDAPPPRKRFIPGPASEPEGDSTASRAPENVDEGVPTPQDASYEGLLPPVGIRATLEAFRSREGYGPDTKLNPRNDQERHFGDGNQMLRAELTDGIFHGVVPLPAGSSQEEASARIIGLSPLPGEIDARIDQYKRLGVNEDMARQIVARDLQR